MNHLYLIIIYINELGMNMWEKSAGQQIICRSKHSTLIN